MANPIVEELALAIVSKVKSITIANGYGVTVVDCVRPRRGDDLAGQNPATGLTAIYQGERRLDEEHHREGNPPAIGWRQNWEILCFVIPADNASSAIDAAINLWAAELESALMEDPQWPALTTGNPKLAINTSIESIAPLEAVDGATCGFMLAFTTIIRTAEADPYTNRY